MTTPFPRTALAGALLLCTALGAQAQDDSRPSPVTFITAGAVDATSVRLDWEPVDGAASYDLYEGGNRISTGLTDTTLVVGDLAPGTGYAFFLTACDARSVCSEASFTARAETPAADDDDGDDETDAATDQLAALDAASRGDGIVEVYFTRHAEKMTQLAEREDGSFVEVCGEDKCAEVLNAEGELRAELLADAFANAGITDRLTHAFSSHKIRTRQTIEQIAAEAGLSGDVDKNAGDGIQEFPVSNADGSDATELNPEGTGASEQPTIDALLALPAGSVALVAGHSGTLYDIMAGLGLSDVCGADTLDTCDQDRYPAKDDGKVKNFGDLWKVTLDNGTPGFAYRVNLQPANLDVVEVAR